MTIELKNRVLHILVQLFEKGFTIELLTNATMKACLKRNGTPKNHY